MASPFSTNELFLRSDRIAFGKIPPEVPSREERQLIVPDLPGYKLFFGLSSLVSTSGITGTLEDIYPQNASFTFDNLNKRLGINMSSPQYALDISTTTGVRITGGTLIANAFGLQSVPTAALVSTLPSYVFAPGSIPPSAFASTGSIDGISVATSALFSTLPTKLFSPNTIPLTTLQSTGIVYASSFIANSFYGDGFNISNIPLANINGEITGNFFKPNTFPLSTLASTGQIWIRDGSLFVPYLSAGQELVSSILANNISTQRIAVGSIQASSFTAGTLSFTNLSSFTLATSSIVVSGGITAGSISGNGGGLINLNPAALNNVIPADKFGYRLISWDAINPFGTFQWIAGTVTFQVGAPVTIRGTLNVQGATTLNTVVANLYSGNGSGLFNLNAVSSLSLTSSLVGLGTLNYISSSQLQSTVVGLSNLISSCIDDNEIQSTLVGLGTFGYVSTLSLYSTVEGLASAGYVSSTQLTSTVSQMNANLVSSITGADNQLISTTRGSDNQLISSVSQVTSNLFSTTIGVDNQLISSVFQLNSNLFSTTRGVDNQLISSVSQVTSNLFSTTRGTDNQLISSMRGSDNQLISSVSQLNSNLFSSIIGSDNQLISTTRGIDNQVISSIRGSDNQLISSMRGSDNQLISSVSQVTSNLFSTTRGVDNQLISSVSQLNSNLFSTTRGTDNQLISSVSQVTSNLFSTTRGEDNQLISTTAGLTFYVSSFIDVPELTSTIIGLGSAGFVSTIGLDAKLASTTTGLGSAGYISTLSLLSTVAGIQSTIDISISSYSTAVGGGAGAIVRSTVIGLGSAGYISTSQLTSTVSQLTSDLLSTTIGSDNQLISTAAGLAFYTSSFIDVTEVTSTIVGLGTFGYVSTSQLTSTVSQLTSNLLSTTIGEDNQLISTTAGLAFYVSSFIDVPELTSTIIGLGSAGFVSTIGLDAKLASTTTGLGSLGYVSTSQLTSTVSQLTSNLLSTTIGSDNQLISTTAGLQFYASSFIDVVEVTSTIIGLGSVGYVSTSQLTSTVSQLTTNLLSTTIGSDNQLTSTVSQLTTNLLSTTIGSDNQLISSVSQLTTNLLSTTIGEDNQLISTTAGLAFYVSSFIDVPELTSTIVGLGSAGFVSTIGLDAKLASTVTGLGSANYVSTASLNSTTAFFQNEIEYGFSTLSTAIQISPGYNAQTLYLNQSADVAPYKQLGAEEIITTLYSTITSVPGNTTGNLLCAFQTDFTLPSFIPAGIWDLNLFANAGAANAISMYYSLFFRANSGSETLLFQSATVPIENIGILQYKNSLPVSYTSIPNGSTLVLKVFGSNQTAPSVLITSYFQDSYYSHVHTTFNSVSYSGGSGISSLSTVVASNYDYFSSLFVSTNLNLISTVTGLGSIGYVSTLSLVSTTAGLQSTINNSFSTFSTAVGPGGIDLIRSTVTGLGSIGYLSTIPTVVSTSAVYLSSISANVVIAPTISAQQLFVSSVNGLPYGAGGITSIPSTLSTFQLLTSSILASTIQTIILSSQQIFTSSLVANSIVTSTALVSTLSANTVNFAGGFGYLTMPDIYPNTVYTSTVTTSNLLVGVNSALSPIQFFGFGSYSNTVIAEVSTGATTQELLMFRGSNATDRIRMQTTGSIVFEPGVSARIWPVAPSNVTPAMIINTSSNIGIQTATPSFPLDVAGVGRFQQLSTLNINLSSVNGLPYGTGGGLASIPSTLSTFQLLTSSILASTIQTRILSSQQIFTSSLVANSIVTSTSLISTLSTNAVNFASGFGYLTMPDIYPNTVYTSTVTTSNLLVGVNSVLSPIQFFGFGSYSNSVIAELSTGATTQELVIFRGSNATDRVRTQTTGSIVFEAGVSARIWPTANSNVTPSLIINTSSNVGIQTATPATALDVAGTGRFTTVSTLALNVSSVNGAVYPPTGGGSGAVPFISAFTVSTGFLSVSSISANILTVNLMNGLQVQTSSISTNYLFGTFLSTSQFQTSSILGNNVLFRSTQTTTISSASVYGSTFTGRWNDAQYYVLQTI